jgi:molecular chaperone DnaJ
LENYYEILGVAENATQDEIKKSFREKSKIMHPDKGGNEEDFKKINEAYDTLGDPNKRQQYNNQKNNPFGNMGGGDPFDMFNQMFNQGFQQRKAPDKVIDLNVGVVDSYLGKNLTYDFIRKTNCNTCDGKGGERITCGTCNGTGVLTQRVGNSFFSNIIRTTCVSCSGRGFNFKETCGTCYGECRVDEQMSVNMNLPEGISDGQFIKAQGYGDFHNGMFGDVIFRINVSPQDGFEKNNGDLIYNKFLSLSDLNSEKITIPHPDGELSLNMPVDIDTSKPLRVRGKGFKNERGDLYVNLFVRHTRL